VNREAINWPRLTRILAIITSIGAYIIVLLGVLVTTTGSGHGCGNTWPFCHGEIIPGTLTIAELVEYSHRVSAGGEGLLVFLLAVASWWLYRRDFQIKLYVILSVLFIILQGALGAVTVVYEGTLALPWILSVHFGLSLVALASVILLTIRLFQLARAERLNRENLPDKARQMSSPAKVPKLQYPVLGLMIYTYLVVYTGALVEHTGAVVGCGSQLPGCGSTYLPSFTSLAGIQVLHRYVAALLWFLVLALLFVVLRHYRERRDLVQGAWWAFILITLQATSGLFNVITMGQLLPALVHTTLISIFFSVLCYLCMQVGWPGSGQAERAGEQPAVGSGSDLVEVAKAD
jgi:cytochrome c oxidase assembly protein subunit 15